MIAGVSVLSIAVGYASSTFIKSPAQVASESSPPPRSEITAAVTTGSIEENLLTSGVVSLGNRVELAPPSPSNVDPIVTAMPLQVGSAVQPGSVLIEIADRPLILLAGDVPLIRDLHYGDKGPDVSRLQRGLAPFGTPRADGVFGPSTERALRALYKAADYAPVLDDDKRATAVRTELVVAPNEASGRIVAMGAGLGQVAASPLITLTTTPATVVAQVAQAQAAAIAVGDEATLTGGAFTTAMPASVSSIGVLAKGEDGSFTIPVALQVGGGIDPTGVGATVQVSIQTSDAGDAGLIVPLAALTSTTDGQTSVTKSETNGDKRLTVTVTKTGNGSAQVTEETGSLKAGDLVLVGSE